MNPELSGDVFFRGKKTQDVFQLRSTSFNDTAMILLWKERKKKYIFEIKSFLPPSKVFQPPFSMNTSTIL